MRQVTVGVAGTAARVGGLWSHAGPPPAYPTQERPRRAPRAGAVSLVVDESYLSPKQQEQGAIALNLRGFARCLVARHQHRVAIADLPLPAPGVQGYQPYFKQARLRAFAIPGICARNRPIPRHPCCRTQIDPLIPDPQAFKMMALSQPRSARIGKSTYIAT
jgi:hypothetical protein